MTIYLDSLQLSTAMSVVSEEDEPVFVSADSDLVSTAEKPNSKR